VWGLDEEWRASGANKGPSWSARVLSWPFSGDGNTAHYRRSWVRQHRRWRGARGSGRGAEVFGPSKAPSWLARAPWGGFAGQNPVSLSGDGNTAIIGGFYDNNLAGAAWIWTRSGGVWSQQGPKLVGSGAVRDASQGHSVSLSARRQHGHRWRAQRWLTTVSLEPRGFGQEAAESATQQGPKLVGSGVALAASSQGFSSPSPAMATRP
jgi:hypothetical protein